MKIDCLKKSTSLIISLVAILFATILWGRITVCADTQDRQDVLGIGNDYTAILYDSTNGLPTSEANAITQTSDGFIWIGGYSGLIRYDGTDFHRFDSSLGISSVFSLYSDSYDRLWIGTNENGLALYDHGEIKIYGKVSELKSYSIRALCEDVNGNIIIATTQGIAYVDNENLEIHSINDPQVNTEYITRLEGDGNGNIYGLTLDGEVFTVEDLHIGAFYRSADFGNDTINTIYPSRKQPGVVYMGTVASDVFTVDFNDSIEVSNVRSATTLRNISALYEIDNKLWVTATNGIGFFDDEDEYHEMSTLPMNNSVGKIMEDHEGNLWFTSTRQGVMKLVPDRFTDISQIAGLDSMVVNSTCVNGDYLYLGTDVGLTILDSNTYEQIENDLTDFLSGVRIRCIKNDTDNNLWLCTQGDNGLVFYDTSLNEIKCYNAKNGLETSRVRAVMQRSDGSMATATSDGLFIIENGEVTGHYGQDNGINTEEILSVEEGENQKLYLGTDGDGIYVLDGDKVYRIGDEDGLTSGVVMRIKYDADRKVFWLITSNSIEYMSEDEAHAVSEFPYSNNYDIFFGEDDVAWVLSSNGIYITKASQLMKNEEIEYTFYNTKSGLPYITTGNSRSYLDDTGYLYLSGTSGVCKVDINGEDTNTDTVLLAIPSVEIDEEVEYITDEEFVTIPAGSKRLVINAYTLTYGLGNPRVSYWLEGFDNSPIYTTKQDLESISYTNLDGGKYTFHLNLINNKTGDIEKTVSIEIIKESSIYENFMFWISIMLISVAAISFFIWRHFRNRTQALIKKQQEDKEFIDQIMHTFAKCVDLRDTQNQGHSFRVAYYSRMLAEKLAKKRGYSEEQIDEIYHIALMHDIGKINIPDSILNKTQGLNDEEYVVMKTHAAVGEELLKDVNIVPNLAVGAGYHHERLDGRGYPRGLSGDEIPEVARLIAVADTFDAMYSTRPYRKQMLLSDVMAELNRVKGTQLEIDVVDALIELADEDKLNKEQVEEAIKERVNHTKKKELAEQERKIADIAAQIANDPQKKFVLIAIGHVSRCVPVAHEAAELVAEVIAYVLHAFFHLVVEFAQRGHNVPLGGEVLLFLAALGTGGIVTV